MEEENQTQTQESVTSTVSVVENVTPPQPMKKKGKGLKWIIIVLLLLVLAGLGTWLLIGNNSEEDLNATPVPTTLPSQTEEPVETPTPKPINKSEVKIQILNGTGISGEAGFLQKELEKLGYTGTEVGNSEKQDVVTTQVSFSSTASTELKDEITKILKDLYKGVEVKSSTSQKDFDVVITTGLKKGATPKPSSSPSATTKASASPSGSPKASPSPTAQ